MLQTFDCVELLHGKISNLDPDKNDLLIGTPPDPPEKLYDPLSKHRITPKTIWHENDSD